MLSNKLLDLTLCFIEVILIFFALHRLLEHRFAGIPYKILFFLSVFITTISLYLSSYQNLIWQNIIIFFVTFCFASMLYFNQWYIKLTIIILAFYILLIADIIFGNLLSLIGDKQYMELFSTQTGERMFICYIVKIINAIIFKWVYQSLKKINFNQRRKEWLFFAFTFFLFWLASIVFIAIFPSKVIDTDITFAIFSVSLGFFLISMVVIYFFTEICLYYQKEEKMFLLEENYTEIEKQIAQQNQINKQIRKIQHDMKNHIRNINCLLKNKASVGAESLLEELKSDIDNINIDILHMSGNCIIDSITAYNMALCQERNIRFEYTLETVGILQIKAADISSLLSNLLDNAMDAAEKADVPMINLKVFKYKNFLTIVVKNSYSTIPVIEKNRLVTTKNNKLYHGLGTEIISDIVEKYHGNFTYEYDKECFTATVLFTGD